MSKSTMLLAVCVFALSACKAEKSADRGSGATPRATTAAAQTAAQPAAATDPSSAARKVFKSKCVVCHGDHGAGDGPGSAALNPKPRAFGDADWQANTTDEQIKAIIVKGGAAVGKSAAMPANPDLRSKADVVAGLVEIVRSFKK